MSEVKKTFLFILGIISLVLGAIGAVMPIMPTAPFVIFAAWCFLRSSPKMYTWLVTRPYIGPIILDWEQRGAISKKTKYIAGVTIVFSLVIMWFILPASLLIQSISTTLLIWAIIFIYTRPD